MKLTRNTRETSERTWILWAGEPYDSAALRLYCSWDGHLLKLAKLDVGGEDNDLGVTLALHWIYVSLSLRGVFPRAWREYSRAWSERRAEQLSAARKRKWYAYELDPLGGRETGVSAHDGSWWFRFWNDDSSWSSDDWKHLPWNGHGWMYCFHWHDLLVGRQTVEDGEEVVEQTEVVIPARADSPEERYRATVTHKLRRWNRRWWKGPWLWQSTIDIPGGIPFPGKGENSWDCGMDGLHGMSIPCSPVRPTAGLVAAHAMSSVLDTRNQRGHPPYRPEPPPESSDGPACVSGG